MAGRVSIMIAGLLLTSCAPRPAPTSLSHGAPAANEIVVDQSIRPPQGLDPGVLELRTGEAQQLANLSLDQIVASLPVPAFLSEDDADEDPPSGTDAAGAPPLVAQHHYLAARMAWRREMRYDAIKRLKDAQRLAPRHAPIQRFLGQIYDEQGTKDRSFQSFKKAARLDPTDPYTIFMLCRHLADQGRWKNAIAGLAHLTKIAASLAESRVGFLPLVSVHLGIALEREGYDLAAIEQWRASLRQRIRFELLSGSLREEAIMRHREQGLIWRHIGDACHRLGLPLQALEAYGRAAVLSSNESGAMTQRLAYTFLRLGRPRMARQTVIDILEVGRAEPHNLALVDYLVESGVDKASLASPLRRLAIDQNRPTVLVQAVARLLERDERIKWLRAHLDVRPADRQVYEQLIALHFSVEGDPNSAAEALQTAAAAIRAFPRATDAYVSILIRRAGSSEALLEAIATLDAEQGRQPMTHYLHGRVFAQAGSVEQALAAYRKAIVADASLVEARLALADLLISRGRYEEAAKELEPVSQTGDERILALRLMVLAETGRADEALRLVNEALAARPNSELLGLRKAQIERDSGNTQAAEFALRDLLQAHPRSQRAYEDLIDLYLQDRPLDWVDRYSKLYVRLRRVLPQSRVTQRERARRMLLDPKSDREPVEGILRDLLKEDSGDLRTLRLLMRLLILTERSVEGESLLEKQLIGDPPRRGARELCERFFVDLAIQHLRDGEHAELVDMVDRAVQKPIRDPRLLLEFQRRALLDSDKADMIEPKLRIAIKRFPDLEAPLLLQWAMTLEQMDDHERAEQIMVELLGKFPDHADTNNSLGYTWADRNQRLDEAERMIKRALDAEPLNPAYLDSLGWVYYKRGRFDDAVACLSKAMMQPGGRNPVILDHLGDALFRLDRADEAVRHWIDARKTVPDSPSDPEVRQIPARVQKKMKAIRAKQPVPVALSPGAEKKPPDGAAVPATSPSRPAPAAPPASSDTKPVPIKPYHYYPCW